MDSILLKQVRVLDPISNTDRIADVLINESVIQTIAPEIADIPENILVQDSTGLVLAPGLVDLYSHSGQPGYEERETLFSLASAAVAGGFTQIAVLPDTLPPIDNCSSLISLKQKVKELNLIPCPQFHFWSALTSAMSGQQMTELAELAATGVVGFTEGKAIADWGLIRKCLEYIQPLNQPVALVANDFQLEDKGVVREGSFSLRAGLPGNPAVAEAAALAALLEIVADVGTPVHLMRISTARGVELIAAAKERGLPVTASTTWMHLLLNTEAVTSYDPNLRLEPPLGNVKDQMALIEGVKEGVIDAIAVDHTPYTYEEKTVAFACAPPGVIGFEFALPLLWQNFVATEKWSALELWRALSSQPQICLNQQPTRCSVGEKAQLVLFDPQQTWSSDKSVLQSLSANTPWLGKQITGRVLKVWNS